MHDQDRESHNKEKVAAIFEKLVHCTEPADISAREGEICRLLLFLVMAPSDLAGWGGGR